MRNRNPLRCLLVFVSVLVGAPWAGATSELDIEFGFNNKPPLFYFENGKAMGEVVDIARQACTLAGLKCGFVELPFQRVMVYLERQRPDFAALGFSKTREREAFATFSEPIWRDASPILLVRAADKKDFQSYASLADMVARSQYVFGGKLGNVYPIDAQLQALHERDTRFSDEAWRLPLLLVSGRFDFTMLYLPEVLPALQASGVPPSVVEIVSYPDMPRGAERYVLFSKEVAPDVVQKWNAAIVTLRKRGKIATLP